MHIEWSAVYCLSIYLPGQQSVVFRADTQINQVIENAKDIQLLGWFKANQDPDLIATGAHDCLYQEFSKNFVCIPGQAKWKVHQRYSTRPLDVCMLLEIDIVMSSLLFMLLTYYSVMTDTNGCD